jgi:ribosomal protein S18
MSETISFKVPKNIKAEFDKLKNEVNWSEELRNYIIERINYVKKEKALKEIINDLEKIGPANVPKGFSIKSVREDRDSY